MSDFVESMAVAAGRLGEELMRHGLCCAVAESCTGGLTGAVLTHVPGSSRWFKGGVIAYDNAVKSRLLGVPDAMLGRYGAVSHPVVRQMALGACAALDVPLAVALSGVAGPDGGSADKPVGTVYLGLALHGVAQSWRYRFAGDRAAVRHEATRAAMLRLREALLDHA
ncbi:MAG: CinA family protein [Deltaproteobacteria bacterium]|jgi:PncC family amidohydrolase|nr:CinA family protein [Deltaproteobacteria bacterium]